MKQKIFLIITIAALSLFGIGIFNEFMANHTYYNQMFASWANWKLIIRAFVSAFIPIAYIVWNKKFSITKLLVWILPLSLVIFSIAHVTIKEGIFGS
jgi:NADH:ubiquinone oxidoreductase subunit 5 (subunit L)/multisubunit Na+/H+ antiporter MnhA subunit